MLSERFKHKGLFRQYSWLMLQISRCFDLLLIPLCFYGVVFLSGTGWNNDYLLVSILHILIFQLTASVSSLYRSWRIVRIRYEVIKLSVCWLFSFLITHFVLNSITLNIIESSTMLISFFIFPFSMMVLIRICQRLFLRYFRAYGFDHRTVAFAGASHISRQLSESIKKYPWMGMDIYGVFDDRNRHHSQIKKIYSEPDEVKGTFNDLLNLCYQGEIDIVYITLPMQAEKRISTLIDSLADTTVSLFFAPSLIHFDLIHASWDSIDEQPIISIIDSPFSGSLGYLKRVEDLLISLAILPFIIVPMGLIALLVKLFSKGPVLFKQARSGLHNRQFTMYKFRTMIVQKENSYIQARKNDSRITPIGAFLRKSSLDELPQFFNVLKGDMSIVGPRPHPIAYDEEHRKIISRYMSRNLVKPGITGLAQINGFRGETDTDYKTYGRVRHDILYIKHWSLFLDLKIIFLTVLKIFNDKNAY